MSFENRKKDCCNCVNGYFDNKEVCDCGCHRYRLKEGGGE